MAAEQGPRSVASAPGAAVVAKVAAVNCCIESVNGSSWSTAKERVAGAWEEVMAFLIQEHKLFDAELAGASAWARKAGWKSAWSPAVRVPAGGPSGAVAILVRDHFGLRDEHSISLGWLLSATLDVPDGSCMALVSLYLISGVGASPENLALMGRLGQTMARLSDRGIPCIAGGDWNLTLGQLETCSWAGRASAVALYLEVRLRTCRASGRAPRLLDYFAEPERCEAIVAAVRPVMAPMDPHRPVQQKLRANLSQALPWC